MSCGTANPAETGVRSLVTLHQTIHQVNHIGTAAAIQGSTMPWVGACPSSFVRFSVRVPPFSIGAFGLPVYVGFPHASLICLNPPGVTQRPATAKRRETFVTLHMRLDVLVTKSQLLRCTSTLCPRNS